LRRSAFWGPMAITIMGGLLVATVLTLFVVPALYAMWFRLRLDEPAEAPLVQLDPADEADWEAVPLRIAAE
jgi:multidrug efflux pump